MSGELSTADVLSLGLSRLGYALSRALRLDRLRALLGGASINLDEAAVWLLGRRYSCPPGASEAEQEEVRRGPGRAREHKRVSGRSARQPAAGPPAAGATPADHIALARGTCACPPPLASSLEQALARLLHHFQSIAWMTYRTAFTPIAVGEVQLRSDAGWGCTLRRCEDRAADVHPRWLLAHSRAVLQRSLLVEAGAALRPPACLHPADLGSLPALLGRRR